MALEGISLKSLSRAPGPGSGVSNIKSARCDLLFDGTTFIFEMLVFFIKSLSFEMYGVVTRFFLKSPLSQTLEETQLSRLLITDSVR